MGVICLLTSDQLNRYRAKLKPQHTTEEHKKEIGGNLQRARKKTGLTQEDVAEILGWGGRKVGRIESGETLCSPEDILSLCQIYDCNLMEILPSDFIPYISAVSGMDPAALKVLQGSINTMIDRITA